MLLNRYLSLEIFFVHLGHGALFWIVLAILAIELPWWASLLLLPIAIGSVAGWAYEAKIVLPLATRLWRGDLTEPAARESRITNGSERNKNA
jgi:hypothetical protein